MRIILTRAIATEYLGSIPPGSKLDVSVDVGRHLVERGFARAEDQVATVKRGGKREGVVHDGIIREFDSTDAGHERPALAADSGSYTDGADGATG
jgi:hypothetical protein